MIRVGLTGGLASGKSFIGEVLASLGCHVIKADELGHQVLSPGGEAWAPTVAEFGPGILRADGVIDRKRLASIVFNDAEKLAALNAIVHPAVFRKEEEFLGALEARDPDAIGVVEAAILIETGSYKRYDRLVLAFCSEQQQIERAMLRDGCTREDAEARLRRQMPLTDKRKYAHYVIDTSGTLEGVREQTRELYRELTGLRMPS
ncbi:MAG TPA: dephospho-CoA kinase [Bryobacteraceae bacterium]|nr:dephospho-CoA kinase [Bryobacteraceae bacterium]